MIDFFRQKMIDACLSSLRSQGALPEEPADASGWQTHGPFVVPASFVESHPIASVLFFNAFVVADMVKEGLKTLEDTQKLYHATEANATEADLVMQERRNAIDAQRIANLRTMFDLGRQRDEYEAKKKAAEGQGASSSGPPALGLILERAPMVSHQGNTHET